MQRNLYILNVKRASSYRVALTSVIHNCYRYTFVSLKSLYCLFLSAFFSSASSVQIQKSFSGDAKI